MSGPVVVLANLFAVNGDLLAERRIDDADGLAIRTSCTKDPDDQHFHTASQDGSYTLSHGFGAPEDSCGAVALVGDEVAAATTRVYWDRDVVNPDTLVIRPRGEMHIAPNPFSASPSGLHYGAGFEWMAGAGPQTLEVLRPDGEVVWTFTFSPGPGFQHIHWACHDQQNRPVGPGLYWFVIRAGDDLRWNLAIVE